MIAKAAQRMIEERESKFLIPSEIVANVQEDNHLDHAFLVLTKVKYAKYPVLGQRTALQRLAFLGNDYGYDAWTQRNRSEQTQ